MSEFAGFDPPDANFTPTPNQFFDRVVGRHEPCVVTVVAILIRATLGWRSAVTGGRRIEADLPLSEFVRRGLSQESARKGLRLAEEAGFIRKTAPAGPRDPARYALRWADAKRQDEAIKMERRALGEKRRVLKSSTLKSSTLKFGTPYSKESERNPSEEKKKESERQISSSILGEEKPVEAARRVLAAADTPFARDLRRRRGEG
jgi:hypothetical protein